MRTLYALTVFSFLLATPVAGQIGLKLKNDGSKKSPSVDIPYDPSVVPATGFTFEAWVTYDESTLASGIRFPTLVAFNPNRNQEGYLVRISAGSRKTRQLSFMVNTSFVKLWAHWNFGPGALKKWTHIAATWDTVQMQLYVNGALVRNNRVGAPATINHQPGQKPILRIGNSDTSFPGSDTWNGEIDEVRLWPYARTRAEIVSTMNLSLRGVPGRVSTWNLDFVTRDTSGNNHGTAVGGLGFNAANTLKLTSANLGGTAFGRGTKGCNGVPAAGVSGQVRSGNAIAITCVDAARRTGGTGFLWLGLGRLQSAVLLSGAALWVNPSQPGFLLPVGTSVFGLVKLPATIPPLPAGTKVHIQFFFSQAVCAVPIFASEGLTITVQK